VKEYSLHQQLMNFSAPKFVIRLIKPVFLNYCMLQSTYETDCLPKISSLPTSKGKQGERERTGKVTSGSYSHSIIPV
jgi:hypothetical protein